MLRLPSILRFTRAKISSRCNRTTATASSFNQCSLHAATALNTFSVEDDTANTLRVIESLSKLPSIASRNRSRMHWQDCSHLHHHHLHHHHHHHQAQDVISPPTGDTVSSSTTDASKSTSSGTSSSSSGSSSDASKTPPGNAKPIEPEPEQEEPSLFSQALKPRQIVDELERYIVGQSEAKRAVAIALRNRWRRHQLPESLHNEVMPKNILMCGPTGTGKTEIARRLATLAQAPFVKVEATKFTEVGFHGRDVDQIMRDLVETSINLCKQQRRKKVADKVKVEVEDRILDCLTGDSVKAREAFRQHLRDGLLENQTVTLDVPVREHEAQNPQSNGIQNDIIISIKKLVHGKKFVKSEMTVKAARPILEEIESERLIDSNDITADAIKLAEQNGIVFIDEIDKICSKSAEQRSSADASSEGVQRDLLPLIEGSIVSTKYGNIDTNHVLFIASGAFHSCKPSDLLAELQGRLPIRVQLQGLNEKDLYRILTEPEGNLIRQQIALLATEGVTLSFTDTAIKEIARVAANVNHTVENIGARRLHTIIERIVSDISFDASDYKGEQTKVTIDSEYVKKRVAAIIERTDLSKFVL